MEKVVRNESVIQVWHDWPEGEPLDRKPLAAFDLDHTLIAPKGGAVFRKNAHDWKFLYADIPKALERQSRTHHIVIFTNQAGLFSEAKVAEFMDFVADVLSHLHCPVLLMAALTYDVHRKPAPGLFWLLKESLQYDPLCDKESLFFKDSFFVGDSAGRQRDFSSADRKFAHNLGIKFLLPEVYFGQASGPAELPDFDYDPKAVLAKYVLMEDPPKLEKGSVYVAVGLPKIGKTHFIRKLYGDDATIITDVGQLVVCSGDRPIIYDDGCHTLMHRSSVIGAVKKARLTPVALYFEMLDYYDWSHLHVLLHHVDKKASRSDKERERAFRTFSKPTLKEGFQRIITLKTFIVTSDTLKPLHDQFLI